MSALSVLALAGNYLKGAISIVSSSMLICAFLKYKDCKYDTISEITLILFCSNFFLDYLIIYMNSQAFWQYSLYLIIRAYAIPFFYAFNMTRLFNFIFELNKIRIIFTHSDQETQFNLVKLNTKN